MKKIVNLICIILVIAMSLSLFACGTKETVNESPNTDSTIAPTVSPEATSEINDSGDNDSDGGIDTVALPTEVPTVQQSYICDFKLCGSYWKDYSNDASGRLKSKYGKDYTCVNHADLNAGCGTTSDYIYLYESRTYDENDAITNIIFKGSLVDQCMDGGGNVYVPVGGIRVNGVNSSVSEFKGYDLNKGAGGDYIYMYVTKSKNFAPITSVSIGGKSILEIGLEQKFYEFIGKNVNTGDPQDLNCGAGGDFIYLKYSKEITGWVVKHITLIDYDTNGNEIDKVIDMNINDKVYPDEIEQPYVEKGDGAHFEGYYTFYRKNSDETVKMNAGDAFTGNITLYAIWSYDVVYDLSEIGLGLVEKNTYVLDKFLENEFVREWYDSDGNVVSGLYKSGTYKATFY